MFLEKGCGVSEDDVEGRVQDQENYGVESPTPSGHTSQREGSPWTKRDLFD